jgi:hypothetical protein
MKLALIVIIVTYLNTLVKIIIIIIIAKYSQNQYKTSSGIMRKFCPATVMPV